MLASDRTTTTPLSPGSDADALAELLLQTLRRSPIVRWFAVGLTITSALGGFLVVLGFSAATPNDKIAGVQRTQDSLGRRIAVVERQRDTLVGMVSDVKFILCAQSQPTGKEAAEKCSGARP